MVRSPNKKQLLVSLAVNTVSSNSTTTTAATSSTSRQLKPDAYQTSKSTENIYDKVSDHQVYIFVL